MGAYDIIVSISCSGKATGSVDTHRCGVMMRSSCVNVQMSNSTVASVNMMIVVMLSMVVMKGWRRCI